MTDNNRYTALALTIRDRIIHQWHAPAKCNAVATQKESSTSLEFLMGRAMTNNVINLNLEEEVKAAMSSLGYTLKSLPNLKMMLVLVMGIRSSCCLLSRFNGNP